MGGQGADSAAPTEQQGRMPALGLRQHLGVSVRKRSKESGRREVAAHLRIRHLIALEAALPIGTRRHRKRSPPPNGSTLLHLREEPTRTGTGVRDLLAKPPREKSGRNPEPFSSRGPNAFFSSGRRHGQTEGQLDETVSCPRKTSRPCHATNVGLGANSVLAGERSSPSCSRRNSLPVSLRVSTRVSTRVYVKFVPPAAPPRSAH